LEGRNQVGIIEILVVTWGYLFTLVLVGFLAYSVIVGVGGILIGILRIA